VTAPDTVRFDDVPRFRRILVPMKIGVIGEEMVATAVKLAAEHSATLEALHVVLVPLDQKLDAPMEVAEARADESLAEAKALGEELGVEVEAVTVRARAIGRAIVDRARDGRADVIVLGSSPRWRRQSRFFSPTVDFVLRQAPCEVLIVAFPQSVLDEELEASSPG
jgi:CIC family chloride channel protein